jgi:hypothetical protein
MLDNTHESFKLDEGTDRYGVHTELIFEGGDVIKKSTYDATPLIEAASAARAATAGEKWGDGRHVGFIPQHQLLHIMQTYKTSEERKHQMLVYLRDHPKLVTFDKFLK